VAATRAKLALICNQDVQQMLLRAEQLRPVLVQVCMCLYCPPKVHGDNPVNTPRLKG
jgi:hypothetical protein